MDNEPSDNGRAIVLSVIAIAISIIALLSENTGPRGPLGYQGPPGETKIKYVYEKVGPQGPRGNTGPSGGTIIKHEYSQVGPTGPRGPAGSIGVPGEMGPRGPIGEIGPKGDQGERGEQGLRGTTGLRGSQGDDGTLPILELCLALGLTYLLVKVSWEIIHRAILHKKIKVGENLFLRWKKK
jgi:hypothetical protein